jgi:membrane protein YqaA with SNARE-associated domain
MLHRLYARVIEIAAGPHALAALLIVSFVESSVFPIPPDILLIPYAAWRLAAPCTIASVAGGVLGYAIGYSCSTRSAGRCSNSIMR